MATGAAGMTPSQIDPLLTCPAGTTKTACMYVAGGTGPLGDITCACYPNANTNTPKNLSCETFTDPLVEGRPVYARDTSPAQFCREQGYTMSATVITEYDYLGDGSLWGGSAWGINNHLASIREVSCCGLEDSPKESCQQSTRCSEGQHYCATENICKPASESCGSVTCNNNNTCDANESCDCSDCNGQIDHCGLNGSGQQLYCTKDTTPACFTDKFPYCLSSACLDGYKFDTTTGQCVSGTSVNLFGGMYSTKIGGGNYANPMTGSASCPTGYTATKIIGHNAPGIFTDSEAYLCLRKPSDTGAVPTQYWDFGGMYGSGGPNPHSAIVRDVNPSTGAASCPT